MRARALAQSLGVPALVSIRGGVAAAHHAGKLGFHLVRDTDPIKQAELLVVDDPSLVHGRPWIDRARRFGVATVSVHDDAQVHAADLVVCGSLAVREIRTTEGRLGAVLHGVPFYLLDRRIALARRSQGRSVPRCTPANILVALGGGVHVRRIAQPLVEAIRRQCPAASIRVAAGFSSGPRPALRGARWLSAKTGLTQALVECDVAVVAGGVTLYEACALGTAVVALAVVPDQRRAIGAFASHGAVIDAGSVDGGLDSAASGVARLIANQRLREGLATRARRLVDGRGADRVAGRIRDLLREGVRRVA
jgi:spore coat polysaccharide biosynthesis predicted glycosyltransferase SpsG